ncbi:MAG: hypothetical protein ACTTH3_02305 [Schwartzia sp. (in: firmicutes)]
MNAIILCEGESDLVILSQYFCNLFGYEYRGPSKTSGDDMMKACRYRRGDDSFVIRPANGVANFPQVLHDVLRTNKINTDDQNQFTHIAVISDHDSEEETELLVGKLNCVLAEYNLPDFREGEWRHGQQRTQMEERKIEVELLFLRIPLEENGALETLLLSALKEHPGDAYLASASRNFIDDLIQHREAHGMNYLSKRAEQVKAPLAVFLAVASPTRIYRKQQEVFNMIDWTSLGEMRSTLRAFDILDGQEQA